MVWRTKAASFAARNGAPPVPVVAPAAPTFVTTPVSTPGAAGPAGAGAGAGPGAAATLVHVACGFQISVGNGSTMTDGPAPTSGCSARSTTKKLRSPRTRS